MNPLRRNAVTVSKKGTSVSYADSRRALAKREAWLGQPASVLRRKLALLDKEYDKVQTVFDVHKKTNSAIVAAKSAGVSDSAARSWIRGSRLPRSVSMARAKAFEKHRKPLSISPTHRADFAYVLGALMGNTSTVRIGADKRVVRLDLTVKDNAFAREFSKKVESSTGLTSTIKKISRKGHTWYNANFGSTNLVQLFNELSNYGTHVPQKFFSPKSFMRQELIEQGSPTEFLYSPHERKEFVRAIFDSRGQIRVSGNSKTKIVFLKLGNAELSGFVFNALKEMGFSPNIWKQKDGKAVVLPEAERDLFLQTIGLRRGS